MCSWSAGRVGPDGPGLHLTMTTSKRYVAFINPLPGLAGGFQRPVWGEDDLLALGGRFSTGGHDRRKPGTRRSPRLPTWLGRMVPSPLKRTVS